MATYRRSKSKSPINRKTAPEIIRLLDFCYKKGVVDAFELEDDGLVRDWYDEIKGSGRYSLVGFEDEKFDWKRWRFFLMRWCRDNRLKSLGYDVVDNIRKVCGFVYVIIPMSMLFYMDGVRAWLDYPNEIGLALFKQSVRQKWEKGWPPTRTVKNDEYILQIQEHIYELRNHPMSGMENLADKNLDNFEYAMWQMTRPYAKIR